MILTHLLVVLAMLRDHLPEQTDPIVDAAPILLLDEVVDLTLAWLLWRVGGGAGRGGRRGLSLHNSGLDIYKEI